MIFGSIVSKPALDGRFREIFKTWYEEAEKFENPGWALINKLIPESQIT